MWEPAEYFTSPGEFAPGDVLSNQRVTIRASYTYGEETLTATHEVEIISQDYLGDAVLYFPQFISGKYNGVPSGTEFILVNNCSSRKRGSIVYYSTESGTNQGEVIKVEPYIVEAGGVSTHQWYDEGPLVVGAVEITEEESTSCRIEGTEFFDALGSFTTVNDAKPGNTQQIYALKSAERDTGFAVYNPNDEEIELEVSFITESGEINTEVTLGAKGHTAKYLSELFAGSVPQETPGTMNFRTSGGEDFALIGLFSVNPATNGLVSLPTSPNGYSTQAAAEALGEESESEDETVLYFPQFVSGEFSGYTSGTEFILVNNCGTPKSGSIVYYSTDGEESPGEVIRVEPYSIAAREYQCTSGMTKKA